MAREKYTKEYFIKKATEIHGEVYDYSDSNVIDSKTPIKIRHKKCGTVFEMTPNNHTNKSHPQKCPHCYGNNRLSDKEFIEKAKKVHGDKYDYSKVNYVNAHTEVEIICPKHGVFKQSPNNHLNGRGCKYCKIDKISECKKTKREDFFKKCKEKYGDKFIYDEGSFNGMNNPINFICRKHGKMNVIAQLHLYSKTGCKECAHEKIKENKKTPQELNKELKELYGDLYTFKFEDYNGMHNKMIFNCKLHGDFIESPTNLKRGCKCKKCSKTYSLEREISSVLSKNNIKFEFQKRNDWLGKLSLDFYLPQYNIAIECQGRQHFEIVKDFGNENTFKLQQERDQRKKKLCDENGIKLLYFTHYDKVNEDDTTFKNKEKLLEKITSYELRA